MSEDLFYECVNTLYKERNEDTKSSTLIETIMDNVNDFDNLIQNKPLVFPISHDLLFFDTYKSKDDFAWNFILKNLDVIKLGAETLTKKSEKLDYKQLHNIMLACKNVIRYGIEPNLPKNILHKGVSMVNSDVIRIPRSSAEWIKSQRKLLIICKAVFYILQLIHMRTNFKGPYDIEGKLMHIKNCFDETHDDTKSLKDTCDIYVDLNENFIKDIPPSMERKISEVIGKLLDGDIIDVHKIDDYKIEESKTFNIKNFLEFTSNMINDENKIKNESAEKFDIIFDNLRNYCEFKNENLVRLLFRPICNKIKDKPAYFGMKDIGFQSIDYEIDNKSNALENFGDIISDILFTPVFISLMSIRKCSNLCVGEVEYSVEMKRNRDWCISIWSRFIKIRKSSLILKDFVGYLATAREMKTKIFIYKEACRIVSNIIFQNNDGLSNAIKHIRNSRYYNALSLSTNTSKNNWIGALICLVIKNYLNYSNVYTMINQLKLMWNVENVDDQTIYVHIIMAIINMRSSLSKKLHLEIFHLLNKRTDMLRSGTENYDIYLNVYMYKQLFSDKVPKVLLQRVIEFELKPIIDILFHLSYFIKEKCCNEVMELIGRFLEKYNIKQIIDYLDVFSCIKFMNEDQQEFGQRIPYLNTYKDHTIKRFMSGKNKIVIGTLLSSLKKPINLSSLSFSNMDKIVSSIFILISKFVNMDVTIEYLISCIGRLGIIFNNNSINDIDIVHDEIHFMKMIQKLINSESNFSTILINNLIDDIDTIVDIYIVMFKSIIKVHNYKKYRKYLIFNRYVETSLEFLNRILESNLNDYNVSMALLKCLPLVKEMKSIQITSKVNEFALNFINNMKYKKNKDKCRSIKAEKRTNWKKGNRYPIKVTELMIVSKEEAEIHQFNHAMLQVVKNDLKSKKEGIDQLLHMIKEGNSIFDDNLLIVAKSTMPILYSKPYSTPEETILTNCAIALFMCIGVLYKSYTIEIFINVLKDYIKNKNETHLSIIVKLQQYIMKLLPTCPKKCQSDNKSELLRVFVDAFHIIYKGIRFEAYTILFFYLKKLCCLYEWFVEDIIYDMMELVKECLSSASDWSTKLQALKLMTTFHNKSVTQFQIYSDDLFEQFSGIQSSLRFLMRTDDISKEIKDHCEYNVNLLRNILINYTKIENNHCAKKKLLDARLNAENDYLKYLNKGTETSIKKIGSINKDTFENISIVINVANQRTLMNQAYQYVKDNMGVITDSSIKMIILDDDIRESPNFGKIYYKST